MASHRLLEGVKGNLIEQFLAAGAQVWNGVFAQMVLKPTARDTERGGGLVHGQGAVAARGYGWRDFARIGFGRGHRSNTGFGRRQRRERFSAE
jgi:hypothetical protein